MLIFDAFDVVVVPFPFTDRKATKRRPALVVSSAKYFGDKIKHTVLAMITSSKNAPWPLDVPINNGNHAGLTAPSVVRMKLFTLDNRLIMHKVGSLSSGDKTQVHKSMEKLFGRWRNH